MCSACRKLRSASRATARMISAATDTCSSSARQRSHASQSCGSRTVKLTVLVEEPGMPVATTSRRAGAMHRCGCMAPGTKPGAWHPDKSPHNEAGRNIALASTQAPRRPGGAGGG